MLKDLRKREPFFRRDQDLLDQVLPLRVPNVWKGVVEIHDSLLSVIFVEFFLNIEWSLATVQQGIQDDSETPYVDSLVILEVASLRDEHLIWVVSWGA